jgi:hypothetical protein
MALADLPVHKNRNWRWGKVAIWLGLYLILPRTTFKLGDMIQGVLDLADGAVKCYQVCPYFIAN